MAIFLFCLNLYLLAKIAAIWLLQNTFKSTLDNNCKNQDQLGACWKSMAASAEEDNLDFQPLVSFLHFYGECYAWNLWGKEMNKHECGQRTQKFNHKPDLSYLLTRHYSQDARFHFEEKNSVLQTRICELLLLSPDKLESGQDWMSVMIPKISGPNKQSVIPSSQGYAENHTRSRNVVLRTCS